VLIGSGPNGVSAFRILVWSRFSKFRMPPRRERGSYFPELVVQVGAPAQFYPLRTQPLLRASRHLSSDRRRFALSSKSVACSVSPILRAASCSEHSLQGFPGSVAAWVQAVAPCGWLEMVQPQIDINRTLNTLGCVSGHFKPLLYLSGHTSRGFLPVVHAGAPSGMPT
jgi:hypothetical protein